MTRNEVKNILIEIIKDASLSDEEKSERVIAFFYDAEQGYGGKKAKQLAKQIEKETGYGMSMSELLNQIGSIDK